MFVDVRTETFKMNQLSDNMTRRLHIDGTVAQNWT
jgi:hypothetical protein